MRRYRTNRTHHRELGESLRIEGSAAFGSAILWDILPTPVDPGGNGTSPRTEGIEISGGRADILAGLLGFQAGRGADRRKQGVPDPDIAPAIGSAIRPASPRSLPSMSRAPYKISDHYSDLLVTLRVFADDLPRLPGSSAYEEERSRRNSVVCVLTKRRRTISRRTEGGKPGALRSWDRRRLRRDERVYPTGRLGS